MRYEAVIFDLDGTLINSIEDLADSCNEMLAAYEREQAARLLRETDLFVSEISAYVGYPDNNYFAKAFKAQYGTTPSVWRAQKDAPTV